MSLLRKHISYFVMQWMIRNRYSHCYTKYKVTFFDYKSSLSSPVATNKPVTHVTILIVPTFLWAVLTVPSGQTFCHFENKQTVSKIFLFLCIAILPHVSICWQMFYNMMSMWILFKIQIQEIRKIASEIASEMF